MKDEVVVKPLNGIGSLKFGASKKEVEAYLGEPQEVETIPGDEDFADVEVWSYWELGHSVYFEEEFEGRFTNFETDNEAASLFGKKIFELKEKEIIDLMAANGFSDYEIVNGDEFEEKRISFYDAQVDFVFEEDDLVQVNWAVGFNDDEEPVWPQ